MAVPLFSEVVGLRADISLTLEMALALISHRLAEEE